MKSAGKRLMFLFTMAPKFKVTNCDLKIPISYFLVFANFVNTKILLILPLINCAFSVNVLLVLSLWFHFGTLELWLIFFQNKSCSTLRASDCILCLVRYFLHQFGFRLK